MKLPRIESTYNLNSQGSSVVPQSSASVIAGGLQKFTGVVDAMYVDRMRDQEEQIRADQIIAQSKFEQTLFESKAKITESIDTDPNYGSARNRWMKESESVISKLDAAKDVDPVWKEQTLAGLRKDQISTDFQIGGAIRQRRKSEVAAAAQASVYNVTQEFVYGRVDDVDLAKRIGGSMGSAASVGAIDGAAVPMKIRQAMSEAISLKSELLLQQGNVSEARKILELNKNTITPQAFVSLNGAITKQENEIDFVGKTQDYITSGGMTKRPTSEQFDVAYAQELKTTNPDEYPLKTVEFVKSTGHVPTQFKQQANTYLNQYNENANKSDIETTISNALVIADLPTIGKGSFDEDTVTRANLIVNRIDSGMSSSEAYHSVMRQSNDPNYKKTYTSASLEIRKGDNIPSDIVDVNQRYDWIDSYSVAIANGSSKREAKDIATKQTSSLYGTFNERPVKLPPTKVTPYNDEESWSSMAKDLIVKNGFTVPENSKIILSGDRDTQRQISEGVAPTELSFPVIIYDESNDMDVPVISKTTGRVLRMKANPLLKIKEDTSLIGGIKKWIFN
jgi:hypothetical protein